MAARRIRGQSSPKKVRLLLDTHVFIWWDSGKLADETARRVRGADVVFVSAVSAWEIAIKSGLGKLEVRGNWDETLPRYGFTELPILARYADELAGLAPHHHDPFDRMLICQAKAENLTIVTADRAFAAYGIPIERAVASRKRLR
ncbi:MAG: type II toxin-antitoxin system VapC family toxin [Polyangiaceae bacterium]